MTKIRTPLVALVLLLSVGVTVSVNANSEKQVTYCSSQPGGQGTVLTPAAAGCGSPANVVCCYRIPDNFIYYMPF